jgi:Ca2+/Na+ antiporter
MFMGRWSSLGFNCGQCGAPVLNARQRCRYVITFPILMTLKYTLPNCSTEEGKKWGICGFCGSILWIGVFSYFMVWWAAVVGAVAGIDAEVMGLTILAAGTSVPDLISSVIVAQQVRFQP